MANAHRINYLMRELNTENLRSNWSLGGAGILPLYLSLNIFFSPHSLTHTTHTHTNKYRGPEAKTAYLSLPDGPTAPLPLKTKGRKLTTTSELHYPLLGAYYLEFQCVIALRKLHKIAANWIQRSSTTGWLTRRGGGALSPPGPRVPFRKWGHGAGGWQEKGRCRR